MMIYIWYNPISKSYQLGALKDFKKLRTDDRYQNDFPLLYKFEKQKSWLADKILSQLNAAQKEPNNSIGDHTFIDYLNPKE